MSTEVSFPRGKGSSTTGGDDTSRGKKRRKGGVIPTDSPFPESHGDSEEGFGKNGQRRGPKVKKLKKSLNNKKVTEEEDDDEDTSQVIIERCTIASLPTGTTILGCISKIADTEITLTIPGGILVTVPLFNISASYSTLVEEFMSGSSSSTHPLKPQSMFIIGQIIPVKILEKEEAADGRTGHYQLLGTINPGHVYEEVVISHLTPFASDLIMSAAVESVEDHGYVMDVGLGTRMKGFLPLKLASEVSFRLGLKRLPIGCVFLCATMSYSGRTITLSAKDSDIQSRLITGEDALLTPTTANPGCKVQCMVMDVREKGLKIVAGNELKGFIYRDHLKSEWELSKENYEIGQTMIATVLYIHPVTKFVVCTLRNVLDTKLLTRKLLEYKVGQLLKECVVIHVEDGGHVILRKGGGKSVKGSKGDKKPIKLRASFNQLKDQYLDESQVRTEFPIGSTHDVRVQVISFFDSCLRVSLKPSVVKMTADGGLDLDSLAVGKVIRGKVSKLTEKGLYISVGYRLSCFVRNIHLVDNPMVTNYEKLFPLGKEVKVRFLQVDHEASPPLIVGTCKKSLIEAKNILSNYENLLPNVNYLGVAVLLTQFGVLVEFFNGLKGLLHYKVLKGTEHEDFQSTIKIGQVLSCKVLSADSETGKISLSLASQESQGSRREQSTAIEKKKRTIDEGESGDRSYHPSHLGKKEKQPRSLLNALTTTHFLPGCFVSAKVVKFVHPNGLLLRLLKEKSDLSIVETDNPGSNGSENNSGGRQKKLRNVPVDHQNFKSPQSTSDHIFAIVPYAHLTDSQSICRKEGEKLFPYDSVVKCRILKYAHNEEQSTIVGNAQYTIIATLKPTILNPKLQPWLPSTPLRRGIRSVGVVSGIDKRTRGIIVDLVGGLKGIISSDAVKKGQKFDNGNFNNGQLIGVEVTERDGEKMRNNTLIPLKIIAISQALECPKRKRNDSVTSSIMDSEEDDDGDQSEEEDEFSEEDEKDIIDLKKELSLKFVNEVTSGQQKGNHAGSRKRTISNSSNLSTDSFKDVPAVSFRVDVRPDKVTLVEEDNDDEDNDQEVEDEEMSDDQSINYSDKTDSHIRDQRVSKSQLEKEREASLRQKEASLANRNKPPETLEEHERAVVSNPNSSFHWLQYMGFLLDKKNEDEGSVTNVDKCRAVGERALKTINFTKEDERLNIWIALINLEHGYGTKESVEEMIDRALEVADQLKVYLHVASMYEGSRENEEAMNTYEIALRKFRMDPTPWISYGYFTFRIGKQESGRKLLLKSLDSLPDRHHLTVISQFAQMEFKHGSTERGKNLFESILANYPRRTDVWMIYLSFLVKYCNLRREEEKEGKKTNPSTIGQDTTESIRSVFERVVNSGINPRKLLPILKKYLEFEEKIGSDNLSNINRIKQRIQAISVGSGVRTAT